MNSLFDALQAHYATRQRLTWFMALNVARAVPWEFGQKWHTVLFVDSVKDVAAVIKQARLALGANTCDELIVATWTSGISEAGVLALNAVVPQQAYPLAKAIHDWLVKEDMKHV